MQTRSLSKAFKDMTLEELKAEYDYWDRKILAATQWGAALGAAAEFRDECAGWIARREREAGNAPDGVR